MLSFVSFFQISWLTCRKPGSQLHTSTDVYRPQMWGQSKSVWSSYPVTNPALNISISSLACYTYKQTVRSSSYSDALFWTPFTLLHIGSLWSSSWQRKMSLLPFLTCKVLDLLQDIMAHQQKSSRTCHVNLHHIQCINQLSRWGFAFIFSSNKIKDPLYPVTSNLFLC